MKVLITCPRAPVAIEWIRIFEKDNHEVILVDSLRFPLAQYYKKTRYVQIASPRLDFEIYQSEMKKLINEVDWVIPNCEDIFYLSRVRDEMHTDTVFFMPESQLLFQLHHKFAFSHTLNSHVRFPKTELIQDKSQIKIDKESILKPVFSRFGRSVILDITEKSIEKIEISQSYPWVQQARIVGKSICTYAILMEGKVLAHVAYTPRYLLNGAAATYFETYVDKRLEEFMKQFAKENAYTGQVAFDFIDDGNAIYVLECNPRATSGLHLLSDGLQYQDNTFVYRSRALKEAYRVGSTLYTMFGMQSLLKGTFLALRKDHKRAVDVLKGVPLYGQVLYVWGMVLRSFQYKKHITAASTFDIEYDG